MKRTFGRVAFRFLRNDQTLGAALGGEKEDNRAKSRNVTPETHC
jgi:hypothetical protein